MRQVLCRPFRLLFILLVLLGLRTSVCHAAAPSPVAWSGFDVYTQGLEQRLAHQHQADKQFLPGVAVNAEKLRGGELLLEDLSPGWGGAPADRVASGALLHHWRATAFVKGGTAFAFAHLLREVDRYPRIYAPQVLGARRLAQYGDDRIETRLRVRQKHILAVVLESDYDVRFGRLDNAHGYSSARSTRVAEIEDAGTATEHALSPAESHGFLWRQNTYWSYVEREGGLYLQVESVSLTRSVPAGFGWMVNPMVRSIPRESLEFLLRSTCNALTLPLEGGAA